MTRTFLSLVVLALLLVPAHVAVGQDREPVIQGILQPGESSFVKITIDPGVTFLRLEGSGDKGVELDLFVRNERGRMIASETSPGGEATFRIVRRTPITVGVEIRNVGEVESKFELVVEPAEERRAN